MTSKKKETIVAESAVNEDVPSGTLDELLEWIGSFPGRADRARNAELARRKPRSDVLDALDDLMESM